MKAIEQKSELEMALLAGRKVVRTALRLKYSLMADAELNQLLPQMERDAMQALAEGRAYEPDLKQLLGLS